MPRTVPHDDSIAISVQNVSKDFSLGHDRANSIKSAFIHLFRHKKAAKHVHHALKDISFTVKKGEFFGIVGRNGSGKSTLLKILAGIYQPTSGSVSTYGKLVPFIELGVGFNPELTGRENVYLNGAMLGFSKEEIESMYDDIVAFAELEEFMDQKLKNYSSGMQVRLAFSMATRSKADILLVDEVLAVGDADFQRKCYAYFKKLKKLKKTVVFVSHDMSAVREYCDRAMLVETSEVVCIDSSDKVSQLYSRLFIEENASNKDTEEDTRSSRWGDGKAYTSAIRVVHTNQQIIFEQDIEIKESIGIPVPGFRLRDLSGKEILGTNTKVERKDLPEMLSGEKKTIVWEFENILADGEYYIDPAIVHNDGMTVSDWWDEAVMFAVRRENKCPYPVVPKFKISSKS